MNRIDLAKECGCFHCIHSKDFTELIIDKKRTLKCNACGCEHYEDGYKFGIPVKNFESHQVFQRSYAEVQKEMESLIAAKLEELK